MIKVLKIENLGNFRLRFLFSDGMAGDYDFTALVTETGPMVEPLRDQAYFERIFLDDGAPTWPNGFDLAPPWLYDEIAQAGQLQRTAAA